MTTVLKKARTVKIFLEMIIDEVVNEICCMFRQERILSWFRVSLPNIMTHYVYVIGIVLYEARD